MWQPAVLQHKTFTSRRPRREGSGWLGGDTPILCRFLPRAEQRDRLECSSSAIQACRQSVSVSGSAIWQPRQLLAHHRPIVLSAGLRAPQVAIPFWGLLSDLAQSVRPSYVPGQAQGRRQTNVWECLNRVALSGEAAARRRDMAGHISSFFYLSFPDAAFKPSCNSKCDRCLRLGLVRNERRLLTSLSCANALPALNSACSS